MSRYGVPYQEHVILIGDSVTIVHESLNLAAYADVVRETALHVSRDAIVDIGEPCDCHGCAWRVSEHLWRVHVLDRMVDKREHFG